MNGCFRRAAIAVAAVIGTLAAAEPESAGAENTEAFRRRFVNEYCVACHGADNPQAGLRIAAVFREPTGPDAQEQRRRALDYVARGVMPPPKAPRRPTPAERERFAAALAGADAKAGGTLIRRLHRIEYLNTLRDLFGIREIRLPPTFPEDANSLRFDTIAEGMFFTPALLDAYLQVATDIADRMVPLPDVRRIRSESARGSIGQDPARTPFWTREGDASGLYFTGVNIAGWSGALWDKAFAAHESGIYRVRLKVSAEAERGADGRPLRLGFYALNFSDYNLPKRAGRADLPLVASLEVANGEPQFLEVDVPLEKGENFHLYCENRLQKQYPPELRREPGNTEDLRRLLKTYLEEAQASTEPTIRFERMIVSGPVRPLPRQEAFLQNRKPTRDAAYAISVLLPPAERAFRRPLTDAEKRDLTAGVLRHMAAAPLPEYGIHYGIRRILSSPQFLYRESREGKLDAYGLASRMSYFLWSTMPDAELFDLAARNLPADPDALGGQVARMIRDPKAQQFVKHFTGQWLGNRKARSVMVCDNRHVWSELIRYGMVRSTEMFFDEILQQNRSIRTFIDSDFTYANEPMRIAWGIPGNEVDLRRLEADQRQSLRWPEPERLDLSALGAEVPAHVAQRGGVLGLSGVLAATGDGVESSPILRGVWVLENLFGTPPPPPPADVPALVVDISQAKTVREILAAHQQQESCAACHAEIDPLGLALENFDAVGGWRSAYYREDERQEEQPVEASGVLPDGVRLNGPDDIKRYLLARPRLFTACLTAKLLEYATGRSPLSAGDERTVRRIVDAEPAQGYGFRDLIVRVIRSEAFQTK